MIKNIIILILGALVWFAYTEEAYSANQEEIDLHTNAIQIALNNTRNGEIVSWHNGERLSSGDVRVVSTYYKKTGYCRIFQSYIKLNGAEKHTTKNVCRVNNVWQF